MKNTQKNPLVFPEWLDGLKPFLGIGLLVAPVYLGVLTYYGGDPASINLGYQPEQPVPYSHALHAGELGIDCRYCHTTVETSAAANIPPTQTCMNCHQNILPDSEKLAPIRASFESGLAVPWVRVHDLPDYVYFDHSAHVTRGVACVECHDRVDRMEVVYQAEKLTMGWCLNCHIDPDSRLRDPARVTDMNWSPDPADRDETGAQIREKYDLHPSEDCSTCHR
jgi:hypothetical protein